MVPKRGGKNGTNFDLLGAESTDSDGRTEKAGVGGSTPSLATILTALKSISY
jgi:hypothetical protein